MAEKHTNKVTLNRTVEPTVMELRNASGLSAGQVARLFGATTRTTQSWDTGTPMSTQHRERLANLLDRIFPLGDTPEERRAALLRSSGGPSELLRMVAEIPTGTVLQTTGLTVTERLGI